MKSPAGEATDAMNASKLTVVALVGVLVAAGAVTAAATGMPGVASDAEEKQGPRGVDVAATHDNGTVTVAVTTDGSGVENVTVLADDERVGTTDANGTVTFETDDSEELELHKSGFEGKLEYVLRNGSLLLLEEEYEYPEVEADDEDGDDDEADDEDDPDEDDETEDESDEDDEEREDEEDEEEETDEDADDEDEADEADEEQERDDD